MIREQRSMQHLNEKIKCCAILSSLVCVILGVCLCAVLTARMHSHHHRHHCRNVSSVYSATTRLVLSSHCKYNVIMCQK